MPEMVRKPFKNVWRSTSSATLKTTQPLAPRVRASTMRLPTKPLASRIILATNVEPRAFGQLRIARRFGIAGSSLKTERRLTIAFVGAGRRPTRISSCPELVMLANRLLLPRTEVRWWICTARIAKNRPRLRLPALARARLPTRFEGVDSD